MNPVLFIMATSLLIWSILAYALGLRFALLRGKLTISNDAWIDIDFYANSVTNDQKFSLPGRLAFESLRIHGDEIGALTKTALAQLARKDLIFQLALGEVVLIVVAFLDGL